jgi:Fe-S-cluster containining protein
MSNPDRNLKHENSSNASAKMSKMRRRRSVPAEKAVLKRLDGNETTVTEQTPIPCFRCGLCCTCYQPALSREDIDTIASALGISRSKCIARYAVKAPIEEGHLLKQTKDGCVFLAWGADGRARCTIHPSRPKACREWVPSLAKPACLEGLSRLKSEGRIVLPEELFAGREEQKELYGALGSSDEIASSR